MGTTANQEKLFKAMSDASFLAFENPKPPVSVEINGILFTVKYTVSNRNCYDNLATPTRQIKANGKVVKWLKAFELAK